MSQSFRDALIEQMPALRALAIRMTGSRSDAEDLTQEALARAWRYRDTFQEGTDMKAWLCRIMQNCFYHTANRQKGTVQDVEGRYAARQIAAPSQEWGMRCREILNAMERLPPETREALQLVGVSGMSYEEAAEASACPVGTMKSRVNRARERLIEITGPSFIPTDAFFSSIVEEPAA